MSIFETNCLYKGGYRVWNYTDNADSRAHTGYVKLNRQNSIDEEGFTSYTLSLNPDNGSRFRLAMNNEHNLGIAKRYFIDERPDDWWTSGINSDERESYRWLYFEDVIQVNFRCTPSRDEYWPYANGTKCINYSWC